MCCGDRFDRDELGIDPEDEDEDTCTECGLDFADCICEDEEEIEDAELSI
jgi:hypothetical protein